MFNKFYKKCEVRIMRFSQRMGYKPIREIIQKKSLDDDLRTGLWNVFYKFYGIINVHPEMYEIYKNIWVNYYKEYLDDYDESNDCWEKNRYIILEGEWYEVFDFLEFIVEITRNVGLKQEFTENCNLILKRELSAYRFIDSRIVEITSEDEINEVEDAINISPTAVQTHLKNAVILLSDRDNPDYRNSIKESISAVESICKLITGESLSLGQALNKIENKNMIQLHSALKQGFSSIYGYTSDSDGIRHGLSEESNLDYEDAKFMLVACSAFVNYLNVKWNKSN